VCVRLATAHGTEVDEVGLVSWHQVSPSMTEESQASGSSRDHSSHATS
jgi:hypothetical protein